MRFEEFAEIGRLLGVADPAAADIDQAHAGIARIRRQITAGRPGDHVFVCSLTSILGLPNLVAYNAAKSGLMGVVRALSREWAGHGIRVNGISPGYVETAMTKDLFADPERRQKLLGRIPTGRFGTCEELAAARGRRPGRPRTAW